MSQTQPEHVDVLVIGAGLSGIGAAAQLRTRHPGRTVAVLEARERLGGTWDLFRYPGIRSDSDMFTFGYRWRPWPSDTSLADGQLILDYLRTVAQEYAVDELIRYEHKVTAASWSSDAQLWTVTVETPEGEKELTTGLLWGCSGYYDYETGHAPTFPGQERFTGEVVHPQFWPEDLDYAGKKVVVIGSGATAITLIPAMADKTEHITMLQRSPTYVLNRPARDPIARKLAKLPESVRYPVVRWSNILMQVGSYQAFQKFPGWARGYIRSQTVKLLPEHVDVDTHFNPAYDPWDQRLCVVPSADLFKALQRGQASIVTDTIETFDETGIVLTSGEHLDADIIVTATGLKMKPFGGLPLTVDGAAVKLHDTMAYKALMLSDVPNFVFTIGYTNASWTLKADLVADYVCRMLDHLDETGKKMFVPRRDENVGERPFMDFQSGYVLRALDDLPVQGDKAPWLLKQNYLVDVRSIRRAPLEDGVLELV